MGSRGVIFLCSFALLLLAVASFASAEASARGFPARESAAVTSVPAATLIFDDFEGAVQWAANSSGWNISTAYAFSPTRSAHAPSQIGTSPMMIYGPFDLSLATAAALDFELWYYAPVVAGSATKYGSFCVGYSTDGSSFTYPYQWSGDTAGEWWPTHFDLGGWSLLGQPQVWIAFKTTQWSASAYSQGAYVDDLTITATVPDTTPPTTTATGWDSRWHRTQVTVTLAATDNAGGSGVASTEYSTDGGSIWTPGTSVLVAAPTDHSNDGLHVISYYSTDDASNPETAKTCTVRIDTRKPTPSAPYAASVARGHTAYLRYKVNDPRPGSPTATVTIKIRNRAGTLLKTLKLGSRTVNKLFTASFTAPRTWRAGTYRFSIYATDQAGNTQAKVASNTLTVR